MIKINLNISVSEKFTEELKRLSNKCTPNKCTIGLAYVDKCRVLSDAFEAPPLKHAEGWSLAVFGDNAKAEEAMYVEIENIIVVIISPHKMIEIKDKYLDFANGMVVIDTITHDGTS